jgi:hypothetical protein
MHLVMKTFIYIINMHGIWRNWACILRYQIKMYFWMFFLVTQFTYQSMFTSIWLSKKIMTSPVELSYPASRAWISPLRSGTRIILTRPFGKWDSIYLSRSPFNSPAKYGAVWIRRSGKWNIVSKKIRLYISITLKHTKTRHSLLWKKCSTDWESYKTI